MWKQSQTSVFNMTGLFATYRAVWYQRLRICLSWVRKHAARRFVQTSCFFFFRNPSFVRVICLIIFVCSFFLPGFPIKMRGDS